MGSSRRERGKSWEELSGERFCSEREKISLGLPKRMLTDKRIVPWIFLRGVGFLKENPHAGCLGLGFLPAAVIGDSGKRPSLAAAVLANLAGAVPFPP